MPNVQTRLDVRANEKVEIRLGSMGEESGRPRKRVKLVFSDVARKDTIKPDSNGSAEAIAANYPKRKGYYRGLEVALKPGNEMQLVVRRAVELVNVMPPPRRLSLVSANTEDWQRSTRETVRRIDREQSREGHRGTLTVISRHTSNTENARPSINRERAPENLVEEEDVQQLAPMGSVFGTLLQGDDNEADLNEKQKKNSDNVAVTDDSAADTAETELEREEQLENTAFEELIAQRKSEILASEGVEQTALVVAPQGCTLEDLPRHMKKYYNQRYNFFSRFDEGILLDKEGWYSVTCEEIAEHIARRFTSVALDVIVDVYSGVGGNTIQFARIYPEVIALDIDHNRIELMKHNANIYGVRNRIVCRQGDAVEVLQLLKHELAGQRVGIFMSPPWGGPGYIDEESYDVSGFKEALVAAKEVTSCVAMLVPKNIDRENVKAVFGDCEIEFNVITRWNKVKCATIYFGELAQPEVENAYGETETGDMGMQSGWLPHFPSEYYFPTAAPERKKKKRKRKPKKAKKKAAENATATPDIGSAHEESL